MSDSRDASTPQLNPTPDGWTAPAMTPTVIDTAANALPANTIAGLLDGSVAVAVARGMWSAEEMAQVTERLEGGHLGMDLQRREAPDAGVAQVCVYGEAISPSMLFPKGPDPDAYFAQVDVLPDKLPGLFAGMAPFLPTLEALWRQAGTSAERAQGYGACTIRHVPPRCEMDRHCENLYARIPVLQPLQQRLDMLRVCSFFLVLQAPEAGGELVLWEDRWSEGSRNLRGLGGDTVEVGPRAGDVVFTAAGNQYHAVRTVKGSRARWTMGGFFAPRRDGLGIAYYG